MTKANSCLDEWYLRWTQLHSAYKLLTVVKLTQNVRENLVVKVGLDSG